MTFALLFGHGTLDDLLATYGYAAVLVFVAVESLGVPFPGETMLIAASLYAGATHQLQIGLVVGAAAGGAILGDNIGYGLGYWGGHRLLERYGKYVRINQRRIKLGQYVFERHGGKVVFFGRFISILRTYAAFLAGTNRMPWTRFALFNAAGGIIWSCVYGFAAYFLGDAITRLSAPVDIALGVLAAVVIVGFFVFLRRNETRLEDEAERRLPD
jgi:membrane protein DedA with SNARE-associated domain